MGTILGFVEEADERKSNGNHRYQRCQLDDSFLPDLKNLRTPFPSNLTFLAVVIVVTNFFTQKVPKLNSLLLSQALSKVVNNSYFLF